MQKTGHFLKNKSTFCFVLQILFVSLYTEKEIKDRITYHKSRFYFLLG